MISKTYLQTIQNELQNIKNEGLFKTERIITSQQSAEIEANGKKLLNFCANNYLGLSNNAEVMKASQEMVDERGYGMSSVRFICGTQDIHKELEEKISNFLGLEDTILYAACFDANGGVFEPLFTEEDAITVSYTHLDVYKRQVIIVDKKRPNQKFAQNVIPKI